MPRTVSKRYSSVVTGRKKQNADEANTKYMVALGMKMGLTLRYLYHVSKENEGTDKSYEQLGKSLRKELDLQKEKIKVL